MITQIEVCLESEDLLQLKKNVESAFEAGAHRIELCQDLANGGLTPSEEAIQLARDAFGSRDGLLVMIRPRAGDFTYSKDELLIMVEQISKAAELGADGVVFGVINRLGEVDEYVLNVLTALCSSLKLSVTFHRAFDHVKDKTSAMEKLIENGVNRVLTSGTAWGSNLSALEGIEVIKDTLKLANNRIEVVIGGGINTANIGEINKQITSKNHRLSYHSNSGVLKNDLVVPSAVKAMLESIN